MLWLSKTGDVSLPPIWQDIKSFFKRAAPDVPLLLQVKEVTHWRIRSKLAVRGSSTHPEIGLFKRKSHQVISIPTCPLHHLSINTICANVRKIIIDRKIEPYNEENGTGILRYLQFVVERSSSHVQLALIVNREAKDTILEEFAEQIYSQGGLHSVWLNFQTEKTNRIFGDAWVCTQGAPYLWERLGVVDCAFHPACFSQAHLSLFEEVLFKIREWTPPGASVLELYAGVGVIGLNLVLTAKTVTCVEINPFSLECFERSRLKLSAENQDKISMEISTSEAAASLIASAQVIVVDPPRKGLDVKVLEALCIANAGTQLIYLSCGPLSFKKMQCSYLLTVGRSRKQRDTSFSLDLIMLRYYAVLKKQFVSKCNAVLKKNLGERI